VGEGETATMPGGGSTVLGEASEPSTPRRASAGSLGTVAVLGVGLIGGSVALAVAETGAAREVRIWDPDPEALAVARRRAPALAVCGSAEEASATAQLVVVCAPVDCVPSVVEQIRPALPSDAVATDVGSTKARIVREAEEVLGGRFVGGHPMAGAEQSGMAAARPGLFTGAPWILTPTSRTEPRALEAACALARALGAVPRLSTPAQHDRVAARLSHLPHLLAYGLAAVAASEVDPACRDLYAGSFRDGTRVALSSPEAWAAILSENRAEAADALEAFIAWSADTLECLRTGDSAALLERLAAARAARRKFNR